MSKIEVTKHAEDTLYFQYNHNSTNFPTFHAYTPVAFIFLIIYSEILFIDKAGVNDLV